MKLNRYNYEEFFILYLDNELDEESRREVDAFVEVNPDLKAELNLLLQSKLTPDIDINFVDKGSLLRFDNSSISLANYEERLISYIDNELTEAERKDVETFVASHPAIQKELNLLKQTKLQPETIVFEGKESLYRKEEKARVISMPWIRIAAAAILLFAVATTAVILVNNNKGNNSGEGGVAVNPKQPKKEKNTAAPKIETLPDPSDSRGIALTNDSEVKKPEITSKSAIAKKQNGKTQESREPGQSEKTEQDMIVKIEPVKSANGNGLTTPDQNPNVRPTNDAVASADIPKSTLTTDKGNSGAPVVTTQPPKTSDIPEEAVRKDDNPDAQFASENSSNKGLRGFLRKVTRTFEKRTNIKATDDDRLLIAGLAIKMN